MSALARFFHQRGDTVSGYDRTPSPLTEELEREGISVHYDDNPDALPADIDLVIYTPAVPRELGEFKALEQRGVKLEKRSQVLGELTRGKKCIAVAGTHGKTTTSTMIAHLLNQADCGCNAFLGGISKNFDSNLLVNPKSDYIVVEKMESATGDNLQSPMLSDSVEVHYVGRLIPSADKYRNLGMEFDRSHSGEWNPQTHCYNFYPEKSTPAKFAVNRVVNGFSTAVMHMHRGDHWIVYIPYQLGYGTVVRGSIPAGSTLIFDLRMEDFWTKTKGDRN